MWDWGKPYDEGVNYDNIEEDSKLVWHSETLGFRQCYKNKLRLEMYNENNKLERFMK